MLFQSSSGKNEKSYIQMEATRIYPKLFLDKNNVSDGFKVKFYTFGKD